MFGIITEFCGEGVNPSSGKPWKKVKIRDDGNTMHNVTLRGTLPPVTVQGQRAQFSLGTYQGTHEGQPYTGYSGFWNSNSQQAPPVQSPPPQRAPQGPPQPAQQPQQTNASADMIKARSMGLAYAKDLVVAGASKGLEGLFPLAQQCAAFITTGNVPHTQGPVEGPWDPEDLPT
jgi:hypothetical protein